MEENENLQSILLPAIPLGCCSVTDDFPGTISLKGLTLFHVLIDVFESIARQGFPFLVISNHHLDPVHMKAIMLAIDKLESEYPIRLLETGSRIAHSGIPMRQNEKILAMGLNPMMELHADVKETGFILYQYPHLIKVDYQKLPATPIDVEAGFRKGLRTFKQMGADKGYLGTPDRATKALGQMYLEECARTLATLTLKMVNNEPLPDMNAEIKLALENFVQLDS